MYISGRNVVRRFNVLSGVEAAFRMVIMFAALVAGLQVAGATADLARAGGVSMIGALCALPLARWIASKPAPLAPYAMPLLASLGGAVAAGAAWKMFHSTAGTRWFGIGGLALGTALVVWLTR